MELRRRWFGLGLCLVLLSGCIASSPDTSSNDGSISFDRSALGPAAMFFPDDLLTAPATELELQPVQDRNAKVSEVIDADGGKIRSTGADGSEYILSIPPLAVSMPTEITLTPLADAEGLPFDEPPENRLGVELGPEGLELAEPAVLTVDTPEPVDPGALTMSYREGGRYAGAVSSSEQGSRITAKIDHFSGYVMVWPLTEPDWRKMARIRLDLAEWTLVGSFHAALAFFRQQQRFGIETPNLLSLAEVWLPEYEEEILNTRTAVAESGCGETEQAIDAYVQYRRLVEVLGVAEDPEFARPIPESLFELQRKLCWEEAYIRCRVTGDFTSLADYFLTRWRQYVVMTGQEPTDVMKAKAIGYLKRCGHWKVVVRSLVDLVKPTYPWMEETYGLRTELELEWKPSGDPYGSETYNLGLPRSTIEGTGTVEIDRIEADWEPPGWGGCPEVIDPGVVEFEPHARLTAITFDQPKQEWVPGITGTDGISVGGYLRETGPPKLRMLSLDLYLPTVASFFTVKCGINAPAQFHAFQQFAFIDLPAWLAPGGSPGAARLKAAMIPPGDPNFIEWQEGSGPSPIGLRFTKGWTVCGRPSPYKPCAAPPFTANRTLADTGQAIANGTYALELEIEVEHTPR